MALPGCSLLAMNNLVYPYKIISWNVRGANSIARQQEIKQLISVCKPDLICLQETKLQVVNISMIRNTLGLDFNNNFVFLPADGTRGGILIAARTSFLLLQNSFTTNHSIIVSLVDNKCNRTWMVTGVYGPQGELEKKMFIRELKGLKHSTSDNWLLMGDFNPIYKEEDKNTNRLNRRLMLIFRRALNHMEVKEVNLTGRRYTWSNGQQNPTLTWIDRVFCTPQGEEIFPNPILQALSSSISDHCPILLSPLIQPPVKPIFRFEQHLTKMQGFLACV
jgi:exonuclease III